VPSIKNPASFRNRFSLKTAKYKKSFLAPKHVYFVGVLLIIQDNLHLAMYLETVTQLTNSKLSNLKPGFNFHLSHNRNTNRAISGKREHSKLSGSRNESGDLGPHPIHTVVDIADP
jgi:hypothetical protein